MNKYIAYMQSVWEYLSSLSSEEFNEKMNEISPPCIREFITQPLSLSEEGTEYCQPTPRGYIRALDTLYKIEDKE